MYELALSKTLALNVVFLYWFIVTGYFIYIRYKQAIVNEASQETMYVLTKCVQNIYR